MSALTGLVRTSLEQRFADVWLEGEVSNLRAPASGHLYLTLKDDASQIRAVLFKTVVQRARFALEDGLQVIVRGRVTVYEPRGDYQIIVEYVEPKGRGALQVAFEQLRARLAAEGLFDESRKRPLPEFPRTVGIVTSLSGAAIRDLLTVLHRRCPTVRVIVAPVMVQGVGSAEQIAQGIQTLSGSGWVDVMIVGRGGGSIEDLWSFNEEVVVRAIAASRVPVVSAVGHETDVTLSDFAADLRAPTPSAAAEAVVPVLDHVARRITELTTRLCQEMGRRTMSELQHVRVFVHQLAALRLRLQAAAQRVDAAVFDLTAAMRRGLQAGHARVHEAGYALATKSPATRVRQGLTVLPQLYARLCRGIRGELAGRRTRTDATLITLHTLSPLATLGRGYSIIRVRSTGAIVRDVGKVAVGQELEARLANGELICSVTDTRPGPAVLNQ